MKFGKKTGALIGASLLAAVLMTGCAGNQASVGYFNAERIDKESEALKAIESEANAKLAEAQQEAIALQQKKGTMSDEEFQMQALNQKYQIEIQQKVQQALEQISKEKKLDAVMANTNMQKAVIHGGVDITDDLLQKLK